MGGRWRTANRERLAGWSSIRELQQTQIALARVRFGLRRVQAASKSRAWRVVAHTTARRVERIGDLNDLGGVHTHRGGPPILSHPRVLTRVHFNSQVRDSAIGPPREPKKVATSHEPTGERWRHHISLPCALGRREGHLTHRPSQRRSSCPLFRRMESTDRPADGCLRGGGCNTTPRISEGQARPGADETL
jgi:hypothetical protein